MRYICLLIFFSLLITNTAQSGLRWPIDRPKKITGTFAEYRGLRYHHGLDISTNGKKGYRIFAAEKGYVNSVMYQKWGIGYAVFIKHKNGLLTIYGHMDRFSKRILRNKKINKIKNIILNRKDFRVNFSRPEIMVNRGTVIGYSGESGIGPPHFHFEVRNKKNVTLNPLRNGIKIRDKSSPVIEEIFFQPMDSFSAMNQYPYETVYDVILKNKKKRIYTLNTDLMPVISGRIGIKIKVYDNAGYRNRVSIYKIKTFINNKPAYEFSLDKVKFKETHKMGLVYDYDNSTNRDFTYYLYSRIDHKGIVTSNNKINTIKIICYDANFNKSKIQFKLRSGRKITKPAYEYKQNLIPGKNLELISESKGFRIRYPEDSPFYKEMVTLDEDYGFNIYLNNLILKSIAYSVSPTSLCLDKPAKIFIKYKGSDYKKVAIYQKSRRYFNFISKNYNMDDKTFSANIRKMGTFFLVRDNSPPIIKFRNNKKRKRYKSINIKISDIGSGVDLNKVYLKVDDKDVIWDYEIDKKYIEIFPHNKIWKKGKHSIKIQIEDRAGNKSELKKFHYFIKR